MSTILYDKVTEVKAVHTMDWHEPLDVSVRAIVRLDSKCQWGCGLTARVLLYVKVIV